MAQRKWKKNFLFWQMTNNFFLTLCHCTQMHHNMSELLVLRLRTQLAQKSLGMKKQALKIDHFKWSFQPPVTETIFHLQPRNAWVLSQKPHQSEIQF